MKIPHLVKNTGIYALGDICPKLFALIIFPILTSNISPAEYGIINYINTIDTFLSVICVLSLNTYFLVFYYRTNGTKEKKKLMGNISVFVFLFSILVSIILHLVGPNIAKAWGSNIDFYPYISLGILINLCNVVTFLPSCLYRVQEKPLPLTILNIIKSLLIMIGSVIVVILFSGQSKEILFIRAIVSVFFAFIFLLMTKKDTIYCLNIREIIKALKFSLPLVPGALAYYLFSLSDRLLIDGYLNLTDLGVYSTAATIALLLNIVSSGAYKAFEPYFFKHINTSGFSQKFQIIRDALLYVVIVCSLFLAVFSQELLFYLSSVEYHEAYILVPIILVGVIASSMSMMYSTIIIAQKKTIVNTSITIVGCIVSVVMNIILLPQMGVIAAAFTFALSFILVLILSVYFSKIDIEHKRALFSFLISAIICFYLVYELPSNISLFLMICIKGGGLILLSFILFYVLKIKNIVKYFCK